MSSCCWGNLTKVSYILLNYVYTHHHLYTVQQITPATNSKTGDPIASNCHYTQGSNAYKKTSRHDEEDRKFNVVIHGIEKYFKGTPIAKHEGPRHDLPQARLSSTLKVYH